MTETAERVGAAKPRTVRMYDDAWNLMNAREHGLRADPSQYTRDMTEAGLGTARCGRCLALVPVEYGDLTGKPLAEWVAEAVKTVTAQHRHGHEPVTIGNAAPARPAASPGTVTFLEPGGSPVIAAPVPEARGKGRR